MATLNLLRNEFQLSQWFLISKEFVSFFRIRFHMLADRMDRVLEKTTDFLLDFIKFDADPEVGLIVSFRNTWRIFRN